MKLNGFDKIAFIYDLLVKLIFGKSMVAAQQYFLSHIRDQAKVLMLGGGSGWLLAELLRLKPNCEVWYIDASEKMIALSRQKSKPEYRVHFIHGTERDIPATIQFDAVITNFYLDLFTNHQLKDAVAKIKSSLNAGAFWIATDFVDGNKWWQSMMLTVMYWFFRILCQIESQQLPGWSKSLEEAGIKEIESKTFYGAFIKTVRLQC